jgi:hypothetical protein
MADKIEIGKVGKWSIKVVPWPGYNESGPWWQAHITHPTKQGRYWLNWNGVRFARSESLLKMATKEPTLFAKVEKKFRGWYEKPSQLA